MPQYISPNSNTNPMPIGLTIPIQRGKDGYFNLNYDTVSQVKANIINLLNTKRGERRFQPLFGSGLWEVLFEQNIDSLSEILQDIIRNDIKLWISYVNVDNIIINVDNNASKDTYIIYINLSFTVNNIQDSVNLVLQQNSI